MSQPRDAQHQTKRKFIPLADLLRDLAVRDNNAPSAAVKNNAEVYGKLKTFDPASRGG